MTVVTEVVKHLDTLTTDQLSGQLFAILAMFGNALEYEGEKVNSKSHNEM